MLKRLGVWGNGNTWSGSVSLARLRNPSMARNTHVMRDGIFIRFLTPYRQANSRDAMMHSATQSVYILISQYQVDVAPMFRISVARQLVFLCAARQNQPRLCVLVLKRILNAARQQILM